MNGLNSNVFMKSVIDELKTNSEVFHPCPFVGILEVKNLEMKDDKFYAIYPSGVYRSVATVSTNSLAFMNVTVGMIVKPQQIRRG